ncbi:MAG TPA: adenosylmethionine--8-amino-7-oxononanoate transaminase [Polyangiaceae bacterium]
MSERARIVELDKRHAWHPYTPMGRYLAETDPIVVVGASGARLQEAGGRSLIDANSSWWSAVLGHGHPRLVAALKEQADRFCHVAFAGITHEPAARLAAELVAVAPPGLDRVFYSDDGSTAVEVALKLAVQYWAQNGRPERRRLVALGGAFHGETLGAGMVSDIELFRRSYADLAVDCLRVPPDARGQQRAIDVLVDLVERQHSEIAAVVLEPVLQGAAGMRVYDPELVRVAREVTLRRDVFLILDEVFTGYGRTGPMWAAEHARVSPDLFCVAKGFTGGQLPMAATLASARIFEGFLGDPSRAFLHGHTFAGHPLGARVALEVLAVYRDEDVLARAQPKARRIAEAFRALGALPGITAFRSLGMMGALDLGPPGYLEPLGQRVFVEALRRGAYLRPLGNTVYVTPPLNIPDQDLEELLGIVDESVRAVIGA